MFHVLTLRKIFRRMKPNDFGRVRFDVVLNKSVRRIEGATWNRTFPPTERNLTCPAARINCTSAMRMTWRRASSTVPGAYTLIRSPAFARGYAFAQQLFMRKIRMRERGTERALTGCPVRYAKDAPIPDAT
jgi:hypothetical protein